MKTKLKRILIVAGAGLLVALVYFVFQPNPPPPTPQLPKPNGYDDFIKAALRLSGNAGFYGTLSQDELRTLVQGNEESLKLVRNGLRFESRVPLEYSESYLDRNFPELAALKHLTLALMAAGGLAEMEARTNDAVGIYLDTFRFSHEAFRGGLVIHKMVGQACEALAMRPWQQLILTLSARQCREAIQTLEAIEAKSETIEEVIKKEKTYFRRAEGFRRRLMVQISAMIQMRSLQPFKAVRQRLEQNHNKLQMQRGVLMVNLAVRAYELEKGQRPKSFGELVPAYLQSTPKDPDTGTNLVYHFW